MRPTQLFIIQRMRMVWSGLGQQGMAAQIYDIRAIPNTLLIDPKGNIVDKGMTHEQIEALLNK